MRYNVIFLFLALAFPLVGSEAVKLKEAVSWECCTSVPVSYVSERKEGKKRKKKDDKKKKKEEEDTWEKPSWYPKDYYPNDKKKKKEEEDTWEKPSWYPKDHSPKDHK